MKYRISDIYCFEQRRMHDQPPPEIFKKCEWAC